MSDDTTGRSKVQFSDREALLFHSTGRPGKIEIVATKPMATQRDLSLAYSPGVAVPVKAIAAEFNVAVFITNQVMSDPSGGLTFVADPKKAVGGHVLAHASTVRLSVRKGKAEQRLLKVVQAPALAEAEASYAIGPDGVVDYKD